ncbi:MAG TPA: pyridoxal phosphate-dependent aminotransferase [Vicinamibacterales bacterium]
MCARETFSGRVPAERRPNAFSRALAAARARGPICDLTVSNPTSVGIDYPRDLLAPLANPAALTYAPAPFGLRSAREAAAGDYARRGTRVEADRIVLTASTSDAYSLLFKLLCTPGHANVLTPVPSYPLFDHLLRLDGVEQRRYPLEYHGAWSADVEALDRAWSGETRALLAVSPNNPTGSLVGADELTELVSRCADRSAALILDEVFCDYLFADSSVQDVLSPLDAPPCLVFRLGGLSKSAGLPQMKLGWIAVSGPDELVREAMDRLELVCDTYLSVSTPVQLAAPALIHGGAPIRARILERIRHNSAALDRALGSASAVTRLHADGGWSAVLRIPATDSEERFVVRLLERDGVVVHPGYFFDFRREAFVVVSLLPQSELFDRGMAIVLERANAA